MEGKNKHDWIAGRRGVRSCVSDRACVRADACRQPSADGSVAARAWIPCWGAVRPALPMLSKGHAHAPPRRPIRSAGTYRAIPQSLGSLHAWAYAQRIGEGRMN